MIKKSLTPNFPEYVLNIQITLAGHEYDIFSIYNVVITRSHSFYSRRIARLV